MWRAVTDTAAAQDKIYHKSRDICLRTRSEEEFSTSFHEKRIYQALIEEHLRRHVAPGAPVLELGAGDGRISRILLDAGTTDLLACDANVDPLLRFQDSLAAGEQDHVCFLAADMTELEFPEGVFSAIVAIEALYYLGEAFEQVFERICTWLAPGGLLIHAEPTLEGWLLFNLAEQNWEELDCSLASKRVERAGRGFSQEQIRTLHAKCGLSTHAEAVCPLANVLAVNRLYKSDLPRAEQYEILRAIRNNSDIFVTPRSVAYAATKK